MYVEYNSYYIDNISYVEQFMKGILMVIIAYFNIIFY